ncbi:MAG: CheB methylesterase domain-containing protein, partial [Myxococcota bacterium]
GRPSLRTSPANPPPPQILAIGSSTGGPNALAQVIRDLGDDWPLPVVVTQHMPPKFTAMLAQRLDKLTALEVKEAEDGDALQPGRVLVAKGDYHLTFVNEGSAIYARLSKTAPEHSCRPAVDVMLRSLMSIYGNRILAVILTGMGQDGCASSAALYQRGGRVIVQDAETSVVWGMPGAVAAAGIADQVLPVHAIGRAAWSTLRPPPRSVAPATLQEMTR